MHFILAHGWAFDDSYWNPFKAFFSPPCQWSHLGKVAPKKTNQILIGVGHSLGFLKLQRSEIPFQAFIGFNAFFSFLGFSSTLKKRRRKECNFFYHQMKKHPLQTLHEFYKRCGCHQESFPSKDWFWEKDFQLLFQETSPQTCPTLLLHARDDGILSWPVIQEHQAFLPQIHQRVFDEGQHLLGQWSDQTPFHIIKKWIKEVFLST